MDGCHEITITGAASIRHSNDVVAAHIEQGHHLILWNNDTAKDIWIDKYDARSHFTSPAEFEYIAPAVSPDDVIVSINVSARKLEKELDIERYKDLEDSPEVNKFHREDPYDYDSNVIDKPDMGNRFAYKYPDADPMIMIAIEEDTELEPLTLPVALPESVCLPRTKKQLDVILHTALKTRKSAQLEIFLKLKESSNPLFQFLNAESVDNPLYTLLKRLPEEIFWKCLLSRDASPANNDPPSLSSAPSGALSYIMDYAGSGSEDEDGENRMELPCAPSADCESLVQDGSIEGYIVSSNNNSAPTSSIVLDMDSSRPPSEAVAARRAERLRRARLLAGHFLTAGEEGIAKTEDPVEVQPAEAIVEKPNLCDVTPMELQVESSESRNRCSSVDSRSSDEKPVRAKKSRPRDRRRGYSSDRSVGRCSDRHRPRSRSRSKHGSRCHRSRSRSRDRRSDRGGSGRSKRRRMSSSSSSDRSVDRRASRRHRSSRRSTRSRSRSRSPSRIAGPGTSSSMNNSGSTTCEVVVSATGSSSTGTTLTMQQRIALALAKERAVFL